MIAQYRNPIAILIAGPRGASMPEFQSAAGSGIFFLLILIWTIRALTARAETSAPPVERDPPPRPAPRLRPPGPPRLFLPDALPGSVRFAAWWRRFFQARKGLDGEWRLEMEQPATIRFVLPMPRRLVRVDLLFPLPNALYVTDVTFLTADPEAEVRWAARWKKRDKQVLLRLTLAGDVPVAEVRVTMSGGDIQVDGHLRMVDAGEPDLPFLKHANAYLRQGQLRYAEEHLRRYEALCPTNPLTALNLANLEAMSGRPEEAERDALRAMGLGRIEPAVGLLRHLFEERSWQLAEDDLSALLAHARDWDLEGHHGLVALLTRRAFLVGPVGYRRERYHAAFLVRRRAAARKFRHVSVPMVVGWGGLIGTAARVRRADGGSEILDDDLFTVGSAEDDNPFIAVARRHTGIWILPDLAPGDVVEFVWETVHLAHPDEDHRIRFMAANIADPGTPTLRARVTFTAPADWPQAFSVLNMEPGREVAADDGSGWTTTTFARRRVLPRRSHSHNFQAFALNPVVGCAPAGRHWDDVARTLLSAACSAADAVAELPEPLARACGDRADPAAALARAFYWVRDHIKYASTVSSNRDLGSPDRVDRVLAAGVGDCKDVSLLLAVVCRHLGIPWEFVLVSAEHGVVLEELPADQFDHMILRARVDDRWLYLDAAGSSAVFSSPEAGLQGLTALAGRDGGALVTIPHAPPADTRILLHETLDRCEDGWLVGRAELRLEGNPARLLDEAWKHHSLVSLDPDRVADDLLDGILPRCQVLEASRLQDTATSDVLHVGLHLRRAPLVDLDGHRVATLLFDVPGVPRALGSAVHLRERYLFTQCLEIEHRVETAGEVRSALRAVSRIADLDTPYGSLREERPDEGTVVRRLRITRRTVEGDELETLPGVLQRWEQAGSLVISLAGPAA